MVSVKTCTKGVLRSFQSMFRMALVAKMRCGSRILIFWLSALFSHLFESLSLKARHVLFKKLSYDVFVGIQEGTARLRRFALR